MHKVILADDHDVFRTGMAKLMGIEDEFRIIAQCREFHRLGAAVQSFPNALVIFASSLKADQKTLIPRVVAGSKATVVITQEHESAQSWFALGIDGVAPRAVAASALIECVRSVARGSRQVRASGELCPSHRDPVGSSVRQRLSPKEMKVLALLMHGLRNKEIADRLNTTEQVIKNYLRSIYDKTGVSDRLELALFTIHHRSLADAVETVGEQLPPGNTAAFLQPAKAMPTASPLVSREASGA